MTNLNEPPPWLAELKKFTLKFKFPNEEGKHEETLEHFTVVKIRPHKKGFIVKSEEIDDRNSSDKYKGAAVYIDKEYLESKKGEDIYLQEVKGFIAFDSDKEIGPVVGFSSNNAQDLLVIEYKERKVEVPFVKQFVQKIDWENKKIIFDLPEGLLED